MTKFVIFRSPVNEQWYFHFLSGNNRILAQSEGYKRERSAAKAVEALKKGAASAPVVVRSDGKTRAR